MITGESRFLWLYRAPFIITDDLKVALNSMGLVLNVLNDLGYAGFDKLQEMVIDVGFEEVLTLLGCMFTSESPLTDTFLRKNCMSKKHKMFTPLVQEMKVAGNADELISLKVYVRKTDRLILYAECREDFVDFLFTFLAIPLEFAWEFSVDSMNMGCVGNLCRSVKDLCFEKQKEATDSCLSTRVAVLCQVPKGCSLMPLTSLTNGYSLLDPLLLLLMLVPVMVLVALS
ncbi:PREDICTED: uncharacterized protein LOC104710872 [Camelina sativa]|uniref:Uncharacterized protein LOC104710872 n=1 Tax=Camelina sativa TaxID=90675 RepID=A0ABM1QFD2_CAMSA|nr:PREDICTED: uncharacterized protein LOC104710872 [Camelina sativa]